jgi:autotransporter-associated beta strand protein
MLLLLSLSLHSQVQTIDWRTEAANGDWDNGGCFEIGTANSQWWYPHFSPNNARNRPDCSGGYDLVFNNNHEVISNNNINFVDVWAITFGEFATITRTINGQGIDLVNVSSNNPRIRNLSSASHVINVSIALQSASELNPVDGDLTFNGSIFTNNHFIDVFGDSGHRLIINGVINGTSGIGVQQNSIVELNAVNTYSGETVLNSGAIEIGVANAISSSSNLVLSGGDLRSEGFSNQFNALRVDDASSIILGSGAHTLQFANSSAQNWAGGNLTIEGWVGTPGSSGTQGQIFVGTDENGLTQAQLSQITFNGYLGPAILLTTGELVPSAINAALFDDFSRGQNNVVGTPTIGGPPNWREFEDFDSECTGGGKVEINAANQLALNIAAAVNCPGSTPSNFKFASVDVSGRYATTFQDADGILEWYFNMRIDDNTPSADNRTAFILGCDHPNFTQPGARGYAVAVG